MSLEQNIKLPSKAITRDELSEMTGYHRNTISKMLNRINVPQRTRLAPKWVERFLKHYDFIE